MIKRRSYLLLMIFIITQSCASQQYNRRYPTSNERQQWETVLRIAEQKSKTLSAKNILSYIRMFLGTSYRKGGTTLWGVDCSGFVMTVYKKALGINLPHNAALMYKQTTPMSLKKAQPGDLLFFEINKGRGISHVGIYLTESKFVHASTNRGVIISNLTEDYYRQRFKGARRVMNFR